MGVVGGRRQFGGWDNTRFLNNTTPSGFDTNLGEFYSQDFKSKPQCWYFNRSDIRWNLNGGQLYEVDTSKNYKYSFWAKTLTSGSNDDGANGYFGFACMDQFSQFINIRSQGGIGNTTLSRDLNPGDSSIYITSNTSWSTNSNPIFRFALLFPATHPYYSTPYTYSRIGYGDYNLYYAQTIVAEGGGDFRLDLVTSDGTTPTTFPDIGYSTPAGTPVCNGRAGSNYNYLFIFRVSDNTEIPFEWTKYSRNGITGETRNSAAIFRHGTQYVRPLILAHNFSSGTYPTFLLDNLLFYEDI